ncbi:mechanosensitive ion channel [Panacibacter ginsenosidivorans]|uniref:Mechanosensitive ion channel n=1 Tax=Panacibacter ginsenosidivorans TaxID=1813871 RepID=A0A5B8V8L4_9BACT|nr:mechanosensitive ion channel domain-containing protein [Panacibacter ginsenosidivorans]QEC67682.1 mechanosensitive ion channel [Panacibacter ginsenosidivorans]
MNDILQLKILNNTVQLYIEVFGFILVVLIIKRIISKYLAGLLFRLFTKKEKQFRRQAFIDLIVSPLDAFFITFIIVITLDKLAMPEILQVKIYKATTKDLLDGIASIALIITFIRLCIRFVKYAAMIFEEKANLTADQSDNQLVIFFRDFFKVLLYILGIMLLLRFTFHYDISKLVTGLSIVGAAIALATKESLENLIASFIIFFDKPFTTGDLVKVQGFTGNVEKIGLRSTRIRTDHKTFITVPNKQMVDTILDNITLRTQRRAEVKLEIDLSAGIEQLRKIIPAIKTLLQKDTIENSTVFLSDTGKNAHIISIEYFTTMQQNISEFNALREEINFAVIELLNKNGVELAAANTDVVVKQKE